MGKLVIQPSQFFFSSIFFRCTLFLLSRWHLSWKIQRTCSHAWSSHQEYVLPGQNCSLPSSSGTGQSPSCLRPVCVPCCCWQKGEHTAGRPLRPWAGRIHIFSLLTLALHINVWNGGGEILGFKTLFQAIKWQLKPFFSMGPPVQLS